MITLITGTPGSGKTAWVVAQLADVAKDRPIYVDGVPELKIPHTVAPPIAEWHEWAPDGALIIVDEVQRIWRPRSAGAKVPPDIAGLETHRHKGIDFWLITQSPSLIDTNVRKLVSRHIHLVVKWAGRFQYEWPECKTDTSSVSDAVKIPYKLPRRVFGEYKSAEIHTKITKRKPLAFYAFVALVFISVAMGWHLSTRIDDKMHPEAAAQGHPMSPGRAATAAAPGSSGAPALLGSYPDWHPRVKGRPESAPAYDQLRKVSDIPLPSGCIASASRCTCYTKQATVYPMDDELCRAHVTGKMFDPYHLPSSESSISKPLSSSAEPIRKSDG